VGAGETDRYQTTGSVPLCRLRREDPVMSVDVADKKVAGNELPPAM
jgi:hypothetical protein